MQLPTTLLLITVSLFADGRAEAESRVIQSASECQAKGNLAWKRSTQLQSRWAEELLRANPLPEYPRPAMTRQAWKNLNGEWDFLGDGPVPPQLPDNFPDKALVPSATQAITSCLEKEYERGWYRKTIEIPDDWAGKKILLHCEAIGTKSTIYFDGIKLGDNEGGFKRISRELPACIPGKPHQILIHFDDTDERMPRGKLHRLSGLRQSVWMEPVPNDHVISVERMREINLMFRNPPAFAAPGSEVEQTVGGQSK